MSNGHYQKVSKCCEAPLDFKVSCLESWATFQKCGSGSYPYGCEVKFKYYPSDFELQMVGRIDRIEKLVNELIYKESRL